MVLPKLLDTVAVLISLNTDRLLQVESESILSAPELLVVHLELESFKLIFCDLAIA